MARTNKIGIDYFPFDVDFFQDDKIQLIEAEFGVKGGYIAIRLLCKIYREGYYYQWGADECLLFTKNVGVEGVSRSIVEEVVKGLVKRGFFNESVFNSFKILTSAGIQKRYFEITKRYKNVEVINEYLLINVSDFDNVNIIPINADINSKNADINPQRKRKETKLKEIENKDDCDFLFCDSDFILPLKNWLKYRNEIKKPFKAQKSIEGQYDKLKKLSGGNYEIATKIIEQSISEGWQGLFELKDDVGCKNGKPQSIEPRNYDDGF